MSPRNLSDPFPDLGELSERRRQTLEGLLCGLSEKQIAAELSISVHTVHVYVKHLYREFRVSSRAELLALWIRRRPRSGGNDETKSPAGGAERLRALLRSRRGLIAQLVRLERRITLTRRRLKRYGEHAESNVRTRPKN